jgi:amidase
MDPYISGNQLAADIKARKVTSVEATEFFIQRIKDLDKKSTTNLVVVRLFEPARKRAIEADAALARGESWGALHGVPITVKENYAMVGVQTTCGMKRLAEMDEGKPYKPTINAAVVQRLLDAGAIIMGKTNLPTEAADFQSYNPVYGTSRNPWNLAHTPGGSSGGSAGAVAAGLTPLEVGSDIGGSIRTPSHFSGVCGHKPTQGAIDKYGMVPPHPFSLHQENLAVAGPICRNCDDLLLMMDILAGPDPYRERGGWQLNLPPPAVAIKDVSKLRVAVWADDSYCQIDTEYRAQIDAAAESLKAAGATVDYTARPDFTFEGTVRVKLRAHVEVSIETGFREY